MPNCAPYAFFTYAGYCILKCGQYSMSNCIRQFTYCGHCLAYKYCGRSACDCSRDFANILDNILRPIQDCALVYALLFLLVCVSPFLFRFTLQKRSPVPYNTVWAPHAKRFIPPEPVSNKIEGCK